MPFHLLEAAHREPAECEVRVGMAATEIVDLYPLLVEVQVETDRKDAAVATLVFEARRDELGRWNVQDAEEIKLWERILIDAAFGSYSEEVFRGYIREVKADYPEDAGAARVTVTCQDDSFRLDREHRRESWGTVSSPASDTQILSRILSSYGLASHRDNKPGQTTIVGLQQDDTDVKFLRARAEFNGYELIFARGEVYFGPMRLKQAPQPTIEVYAGPATNCLRLNVRADGHQPDEVAFDLPAASGSTSTPKSVASGLERLGPTSADSLASALEPFVWKLSGEASADVDRLTAIAQQKADDADIHRVQAEGELDGSLYGHVLLAGLPVTVDGLGERFSGTYYVDKVSHRFGFDGYRQTFGLLRNAFGDNIAEATPGLDALRSVL